MLLSLDWAYELDVADAERAGQFVDAYDRRIASALLEAAYVLLTEAGKVRQLLLGQTFLLPDSFNVPPDQFAHIHATEVSGLRSANLSTEICILSGGGWG